MTKRARKQAKKLFPKTKRNEHQFSAEDYKALPKGKGKGVGR